MSLARAPRVPRARPAAQHFLEVHAAAALLSAEAAATAARPPPPPPPGAFSPKAQPPPAWFPPKPPRPPARPTATKKHLKEVAEAALAELEGLPPAGSACATRAAAALALPPRRRAELLPG